ncbi:hypothetical protein VTK56DRAFT_1479 [Thermocarpiscus australiensis]
MTTVAALITPQECVFSPKMDLQEAMATIRELQETVAGLKQQISDLNFVQASVAAARRRTFDPLPMLSSEGNLDEWDQLLMANLASNNLSRYIEKDVPAPEDKESPEYATWLEDRQEIFQLIMTSLGTDTIWRMRMIGWVPDGGNPRDAYIKVLEALQPTQLVVKEFFELKPENFESLDAYLNRVYLLRQRMGILEVDLETAEMWTILSAMKDSCPDLYERNARMLKDKSLTFETLISDMTAEAAAERLRRKDSEKSDGVSILTALESSTVNKANMNATIPSNKTNDDASTIMNNTNKTSQSDTLKEKGMKNCGECGLKVQKSSTHCKGCGRHYPRKAACWVCHPEEAPIQWPGWERALRAKARKQRVSADGPRAHEQVSSSKVDSSGADSSGAEEARASKPASSGLFGVFPMGWGK